MYQKKKIDKKKHKPNFKYEDSNVFEVKTYLIEKSSSLFIKRSKKRIELKFKAVSGYK